MTAAGPLCQSRTTIRKAMTAAGAQVVADTGRAGLVHFPRMRESPSFRFLPAWRARPTVRGTDWVGRRLGSARRAMRVSSTTKQDPSSGPAELREDGPGDRPSARRDVPDRRLRRHGLNQRKSVGSTQSSRTARPAGSPAAPSGRRVRPDPIAAPTTGRCRAAPTLESARGAAAGERGGLSPTLTRTTDPRARVPAAGSNPPPKR